MGADLQSLKHRRLPVQERARKRVDRILDAAAQIVIDEGLAKLTTNRIAERAGVPIGTLYQYFPNKSAILVALEERFTLKSIELLDELIETGDNSLDLFDELVDRLAILWRNDQELMLKWHVLRTEPIFAALDDEYAKDVRRRNILILKKIGINAPSKQAIIAALMRETLTSQLDYAANLPKAEWKKAIREIKRMFRAYLETYLDN